MSEKLEIRNKADIDRSLPLISIIGRPNVGKSTLFNRLIGERRAITDPTPGVTRDPIPARYLLGNHPVTLVDSGGVKLEKEGLDYAVSEKSLSLMEISDLILFVLECTELTGEDMMLIEELRPYSDKVILVINKVDDVSRYDLVWNFFSYGYQRVVGISAAHGTGFEELEDTMLGMLSLERVEQDGTFEYKGTDYTVLDTAGIRRKSKVEEDVEYYSVNRAIKTIDESDVVLLMVDIKEGLAEQDKKIANLIVRRGKGIVLVLNKVDLLSNVPNQIEAIKDRVRFLFPILSFAPIVTISALEADGVAKMLDTVWAVWKQLNKRVDTASLNDALKEWTSSYEIPRASDGYYKILYGTQVSTKPVRFLLFVNKIKDFPETYLQYIKNQLRKNMGFSSIPIEINLRERRRNPSLKDKGPSKDELDAQRIVKRSQNSSRSKGVMKKPGGKARIGKERERAEKIVRNRKQRKGK